MVHVRSVPRYRILYYILVIFLSISKCACELFRHAGRVGSKAVRGGVAAAQQTTAAQNVRKRCHPLPRFAATSPFQREVKKGIVTTRSLDRLKSQNTIP